MPKTTRKPQQPNDDPAVRAAFITRKGTIVTAAIAALATVIVAAIGLAGKWNEKPPTAEKEKLIIKVLDKDTSKAVAGAKVSVEGNGVPAVNTTDSEGVITFPLADPKKELRIRGEASGYESNYNLRVTPANIEGAQEIRLTPIRILSPSPSPQILIVPPGLASAPNRSVVVRGQVVDESGAGIPGARVTLAGHGPSVLTNESGNFEMPAAVAIGKTIDLRVEKEGFRTRTQEHIAGEHRASITLRK
jgi:hypothetical protein